MVMRVTLPLALGAIFAFLILEAESPEVKYLVAKTESRPNWMAHRDQRRGERVEEDDEDIVV